MDAIKDAAVQLNVPMPFLLAIVVPIVGPVLLQMDIDPIWLGVLIAMPGVASDCYDIVLENAAILVRGERLAGLNSAPGAILRLEIPYGKFERRIALPHAKYELISAQMENGCLRLLLERRK